MFGNARMAYTGTRNNCGPNSTPTKETYVVEADTWFASTQIAADALAQADINANAQNYINSNASCLAWTRQTERLYDGQSGNFNWTAPSDVGGDKVDAFLVGGGSGGNRFSGGGSGYTKTFLNIAVTPGQVIPVTIGAGGAGASNSSTLATAGGYTQFLNSTYRANGGNPGTIVSPYVDRKSVV